MRKLIDYQRDHGTAQLVGKVLSPNAGMLRLAKALGFHSRLRDAAQVYTLSPALQPDDGTARHL